MGRLAAYGDANNFTSTSANLTQSVTKFSPVVTATPSANPSGAGSGNIVFNFSNFYSRAAYRIVVNGSTAQSGNIGTTDQNGTSTSITFNLNSYAAGSYSITAYLDLDAYNNSASATVAQLINPPIVLEVAPNPVAAGATFVATATVTGASPSGIVTFRDGATTLGTGTLSAGVATLSTSIAAAGTHTVTAVYAGDANNPTSTSSPVNLVVGTDTGLVSPGDMRSLIEYDANGNVVKVTDPIGHTTITTYDSLNRVATSILPAHTSGATPGVVTTTMDAADNVKAIKDPRNNSTTYTVNGVGLVTTVASPDAGATNYTYDVVGYPLTKTDARGKVSTMAYDEEHRLKSVTYSSGVGMVFTYDGGASPVPTDIGHLTKVTDESGSTVFGYDQLGRVVSKTVVINGKSFTVQYAYGTSGNAAGSLIAITYPSGSVVNYGYGADGIVNAVSLNRVNPNGVGVNPASVSIASAITFNALGSPTGWTWASGVANTRTYDAFGRIASFLLGNPQGTGVASGIKRTVTYDAAGKPTAFTHDNAGGAQATLDHSYSYDGRSRVINATVAGTSTGYEYDLTDNRTDLVTGGRDLVQTIAAASNRLTASQEPGPVTKSISYDANGNVLNDGTFTYTYSDRGRMATAVTAGGTVTYLYNAMEQRVQKAGPSAVVPTGAAFFIYDESGRLLGEYDATGAPVYESVYLADAPVGVLKTSGTAAGNTLAVALYNVYTDHLNTPRVITRSSDEAIIWRWDAAEVFGGSAPNQNPNALGAFVFNQRFPGQVFDAETGNFQNWHREYSARIGRYVQSDPIGLRGGINTYGYVGGNPLTRTDSRGLATDPPPLVPMHSESTIKSPSGNYSSWSRESTASIVDSLKPGKPEPLKVGPDGKIWDGNTRVYDFLGRPDPLRTSESDRHNVALLIFVLSNKHSSLGDPILTRTVRYIRIGVALNLTTVLLLILCLCVSGNAKELVTFVCWLR